MKSKLGWITLPFLPFVLAGQAYAQTGGEVQASAQPVLPAFLNDRTPCVPDAARYHGVNPWILKAILKVESGFNPQAINKNANKSIDVGMAQINSIHFKELASYGIAPAHLMDGCIATYIAAWHLAKQMRVHGNTWFGIASYHSATPCLNTRYAGLLWNTLVGWSVMAGPRVRIPRMDECGGAGASASTRGQIRSSTSASVAFDSD